MRQNRRAATHSCCAAPVTTLAPTPDAALLRTGRALALLPPPAPNDLTTWRQHKTKRAALRRRSQHQLACANLFLVSCRRQCRRYGATTRTGGGMGSRLRGGAWGGCSVGISPPIISLIGGRGWAAAPGGRIARSLTRTAFRRLRRQDSGTLWKGGAGAPRRSDASQYKTGWQQQKRAAGAVGTLYATPAIYLKLFSLATTTCRASTGCRTAPLGCYFRRAANGARSYIIKRKGARYGSGVGTDGGCRTQGDMWWRISLRRAHFVR